MSSKHRHEISLPRRDFLKKSIVTAGVLGAGGTAESKAVESDKADAGLRSNHNPRKRYKGSREYNAEYEGGFLNRVAFPLGGIGAGMICLEGYGALSHVSLRHKPDIFNEPQIFAALCVKGSPNTARVLEGQVPSWKLFGRPESGMGSPRKLYGLPRFDEASFKARFPFGTVQLKEDKLPVDVEVTGWSPFEPGDADHASMPMAGMEYTFTNHDHKTIEAVFSFNAENFMAIEPNSPGRHIRPTKGGFILAESGVEDKPWSPGAFCARVDDSAVKVNCAWFRGGFWDAVTMAWKDIEEGACYDQPPVGKGEPAPGASLFVPFKLKPGQSKTVKVQLSWFVGTSHLRYGEAAGAEKKDQRYSGLPSYKPFYSSKFNSVEEVADYWSQNYAKLKKASQCFSKCFYDTNLPPEVTEAVAANLTILKSPTILRQQDGRLWGWEGCRDSGGSCYGTCTHVWNYAQSIPHLFPQLERTLRETEFFVSQNEEGHQAFRTPIPIRPSDHKFHAAADGQLGGIIKVYREWRISGDTNWLRRIWPKVKQSLHYCMDQWDPKRKGVLEEPHHNTYDIEFWGPEGMCTSFYLGALAAASRMGRALGEDVGEYEKLIEKGERFVKAKLFNGEYFHQKIKWEGLRAGNPLEAKEYGTGYTPEAAALLQKEGPKYQYGKGCLSDGVLGSWLAIVCGVGQVMDRDMVAKHVRSVFKYNHRKDLSEHVNPQRPGYACGTEGGLLLCSWPHGGELSLPFVYSNEVWVGIEYQVASHLMSMGMVEEGLEIVRTLRDRYDGRVRNPFNEIEAGHWYARAMASYALLQGLSGIRYDAVDKILFVHPRMKGDFRCFFAAEGGYGTVGVRNGKPFIDLKAGNLEIEKIDYQPCV